MYTQYTCGFPKIFGEQRQLYDACNTRPLPPYAKGVVTETSMSMGRLWLLPVRISHDLI